MMNEEKKGPLGRQEPPGTWPSRRKRAGDSGKGGQERVAELLAGHEIAIVLGEFHTYRRRWTRIGWVPIKQALPPGESE
jgi:hypothetical protein